MSFFVMAVVLMAALLHATWNALLKSGHDKFTDTILLSIGAGIVSAIILPFLPAPATASWNLLAASFVMQLVYYCLLAAVYKMGDFSFAYPLMRGSAPLFTGIVSHFYLHEKLSQHGWIALFFICGGILSLFIDNLCKKIFQPKLILFALLNATVIAAYTLLDGMGVRLSGHTLSYVLWVFLLNGIGMGIIGWLFNRPAMKIISGKTLLKGVLTGTLGIISYGLALWAMTKAPISLIAGLRETSILFGITIATLVLKERFSMIRGIAVLLIMSGTIIMKAKL
jgi:drug/metabolite transporter (DMT)-like permease